MTLQPPGFSAELYPHQEEGVKWALDPSRDKAVVAFAVGLGKTLVALATFLDRWSAGQLPLRGRRPLFRCLWITDANLVAQTLGEIEKFCPDVNAISLSEYEKARGTNKVRDEFGGCIDILVMSHDTARSRKNWLDAYDPAMVVVDEVGALRNGGNNHKAIKRVTARTPYVLGLTGTVVENNPMDLWNVCDVVGTADLWPARIFGQRFVNFVSWTNPQTGRSEKRPVDWKTNELSEVGDYVEQNILRRTANDAGLRLPERVGESSIWVPVSPTVAAEYARHEEKNPGDAMGLERLVLHAEESAAILAELKSVLLGRGLPQAIVHSEHLTVCDRVERLLEGMGVAFVRIDGLTSDKQRLEAAVKFRCGEVRVLIGTKILERGLNLQTANLVVSLGSPWNPASEEQVAGRVCRLGSPHAQFEHVTIRPDLPLFRSQANVLDRKSDVARQVGLA